MGFEVILKEKQEPELNIIKVIGVGGAGGNAVNNMVKKGIYKVDYYLVNTDAQDFEKSPISDTNKIQIGKTLTKGLGAGNDPEFGKEAAKESIEELKKIFDDNTKMVFITAGMGGGTGTGASPIVAKLAKEKEILTVAIVTFPAQTEGKKRLENARKGLEELKKNVDSIIVINNSRINKLYKDLEVTSAWEKADEILSIAVKGIAEIITIKGYINVDFADVRSVLKDSGVALMSLGEGEGKNRAAEALSNAIDSPLLNNNDITGAQNVLLNISASKKNMIKTRELDNILLAIQELTNKTNIIHGISENDELGEKIRITLIATGFPDKNINIEEDENESIDKDFLEAFKNIIEEKRRKENKILASKKRKEIERLVNLQGEINTDYTVDDIKKEINARDDDENDDKQNNSGSIGNNDITDSPYFDKSVD